jgi:PAS domain S-box-containing protein
MPEQDSVRLQRRVEELEREIVSLQRRVALADKIERDWRSSQEWLQLIIDSAVDYAIFTLDEAGIVTSWNRGAERLLGYKEDEIIGRDGRIVFTPEDREVKAPEREIQAALSEGRALDERWHLRKDGSRFWGSGLLMPLKHEAGPGFLKIMRDETERQRSDELKVLLIGELDHRIKNTLSMVQAIARQSVQRADSLEAFETGFMERLQALARAHDILINQAWVSADLPDVVGASLQGWLESGRVTVSGPSLRISPKQAVALSLAFNELATNAVKHGALATPTGWVEVFWSCEPECVIRWTERGGPPVSPPERQGFGTVMLNRALASELAGSVDLDFNPAGLTCIIRFALSAESSAPHHSEASSSQDWKE